MTALELLHKPFLDGDERASIRAEIEQGCERHPNWSGALREPMRSDLRVNYAIVFVSDMKRSVAFYRDVLGLPLKFESPGWTEFATDGTTLALHKAGTPAAASTDPAVNP